MIDLDATDILTERLRLTVITREMLDAGVTHLEQLANLVRAEIPYAWPPENWEPHVFDFLKQQLDDHPHTAGWTRYVILRDPKPILIGTLGGFLKGDSEAEFGYSILPGYQGRGLATEGARAFIAGLFANPAIQSVVAQTFADQKPSLRVMEKCGLEFAGPGDDPGTVRYRLKRPSQR